MDWRKNILMGANKYWTEIEIGGTQQQSIYAGSAKWGGNKN